MTIVGLSWLVLGAGLFETILAGTPLQIYFEFHQCKLTVSVLHGFCRDFSLIFQEEGTAGPKHPHL